RVKCKRPRGWARGLGMVAAAGFGLPAAPCQFMAGRLGKPLQERSRRSCGAAPDSSSVPLLYRSAAAAVKALGTAAQALHEAIAIVVDRKAEGADQGEERDGVDVLLVAHVGAEVGRDPCARNAPKG